MTEAGILRFNVEGNIAPLCTRSLVMHRRQCIAPQEAGSGDRLHGRGDPDLSQGGAILENLDRHIGQIFG